MQAQIYSIAPFDTAVGTTIKFSWNGNQAFKNRCIIKDAETNATVYDMTVETFKLQHELNPTNLTRLDNGRQYTAFITVFDKDNNESDLQGIGQRFWCFTTPVFKLGNISEGAVIQSSSYEFTLSYSQSEGESLDSWSIMVYSKTHSLVSDSGIHYDIKSLSYNFSGFNSKTEYYVRATGKTINGIALDTGYVGFSASFSFSNVFSLLEPTNLPEEGAIHVKANIISAEGDVNPPPPVYINNEMIDLRKATLTYIKGFAFEDDFSYAIYFTHTMVNRPLIILGQKTDTNAIATVMYREGHFGSAATRGYFELRVKDGAVYAYYRSKLFSPVKDTDRIGLCIYRKGSLWEITAAILNDDNTVKDGGGY